MTHPDPCRYARRVPDEARADAREPLRVDAERNRERILAAARKLIVEHGLDISHDDIARTANVGVGTVYRRFPTQQELFDELFYDELDLMVGTALAASEVEDPWEGIRQFLEQIFEQQVASRGLRELLIGHRGGTELSRRAQEQIRPVVARLVDRAHASGQLRVGVGASDLAMIIFTAGRSIEGRGEVPKAEGTRVSIETDKELAKWRNIAIGAVALATGALLFTWLTKKHA